MSWTPVSGREAEYGLALVERIRDARRAPGVEPDWLPPDSLVEADGEDASTGLRVLAWIRTAVAAGYGYGMPGWLPCAPDFAKSALFERLRSGKEPLAEPPPLGMSCPWYALIEDPGPHYVMDAWFDPNSPDRVVVLNNPYRIVERLGPEDVIVRDAGHDTSYRFRLRRDPAYVPRRRTDRENDGWFLSNLALSDQAASA